MSSSESKIFTPSELKTRTCKCLFEKNALPSYFTITFKLFAIINCRLFQGESCHILLKEKKVRESDTRSA